MPDGLLFFRHKRFSMITIFLFACMWICTAKGLMKTSAILTYAFLLFIVVTAIFRIDSVYLLPVVVVYAICAIVAAMRPWSALEIEKPRKTIKRWWKHPRELFGYRIMNIILYPLPLSVLSWIGGKSLELFGPLVKKRQTIMYENLRMTIPECANRDFMRRVWNNWGRSFVEGLKFSTYRRNMTKYVTFRNHGMLFKHPQFILTMPHYGYMGIMSMAFINSGLTIAVTYRPVSKGECIARRGRPISTAAIETCVMAMFPRLTLSRSATQCPWFGRCAMAKY